jgi:hypothetical protein
MVVAEQPSTLFLDVIACVAIRVSRIILDRKPKERHRADDHAYLHLDWQLAPQKFFFRNAEMKRRLGVIVSNDPARAVMTVSRQDGRPDPQSKARSSVIPTTGPRTPQRASMSAQPPPQCARTVARVRSNPNDALAAPIGTQFAGFSKKIHTPITPWRSHQSGALAQKPSAAQSPFELVQDGVEALELF